MADDKNVVLVLTKGFGVMKSGKKCIDAEMHLPKIIPEVVFMNL